MILKDSELTQQLVVQHNGIAYPITKTGRETLVIANEAQVFILSQYFRPRPFYEADRTPIRGTLPQEN